MDPALFAGAPEIGAARSPVGRADEARIAPAAPRAPRHHHALAPRREIAQLLARGAIGDHGAEGHAQDRVLAGGAVLGRALAVLAALRRVVALVVGKSGRGDVGVCVAKDASAVAAATAVGSAAR